jgi:hypothetical protein
MLAAGLVVVLVVSAVLIGTAESPASDTIAFELRKYIIQFLLIVALGAVVAFLVDYAKRRAESAEEDRRKEREAADRERQYAIDTVTSLLDRLDAIYRAVKRKRRSLRLVSISDLTEQDYVNDMSKLSEDKEDVEKLWRDIEALEPWLAELNPAKPCVKSMEKYLNLLEDEWERVAPEPDDSFQAEHLQFLKGFRAKQATGESDFQRFRTPYYDARSALIALVAKRRTDVVPPDSQ